MKDRNKLSRKKKKRLLTQPAGRSLTEPQAQGAAPLPVAAPCHAEPAEKIAAPPGPQMTEMRPSAETAVGQRRKTGRRTPWFHLLTVLFLAALALAIYANTLQSPFVFDDRINITDNPPIKITELTAESLARAAFKSPLPARYLANISLGLNYYFHQFELPGYHLVNIAIHAATGILLYFLAFLTLRTPALRASCQKPHLVALGAAALWLAHPIQTQSVTYVVQRMNSMATMFYLLAMLLYAAARLSPRKGLRALLFGGCALSAIAGFGSKEIVFTLPFFLLLYEFYFFRDLNPGWLKSKFFLTPLVLLVLLLGFEAATHLNAITSGYEVRNFTMTERLLTEPRVVLFYLSQLLFPSPARLNLFHDISLSISLMSPFSTLLALTAIGALLGLALYLARRQRLASFAILWFFGNHVIESSVLALEIIFEHRNYLPSTFLCLLASYLVLRFPTRRLKLIAPALICLTVIIFSFWTYERNRTWKDEETLLLDCLAKAPDVARTQASLGYALMWKWELDEAMRRFQIALRLNPVSSVREKIWDNMEFIRKMKTYPNYHKE